MLDHVHPLMAEVVGKSIPGRIPEDDLPNLRSSRCKARRGLRDGYLDRKSPLDDVTILQAHIGAVQDPL